MTITISGTVAQTQFNDSTTTATIWETLIDGGINLLNTYGANITNLSGTAGSKSVSLTSAEAGAVMAMTQQIYSKHYKNATGSNTAAGPLNITYSNDGQLLSFAKQLAFQLKGNVAGRVFLRT